MNRIVAFLLLACSCADVLAQGQVQFRNFWTATTPQIDAPVFLVVAGLNMGPLDGSNPLWRAALLGGPANGTAAYIGPGSARRGNLSMLHHPTTTTLTWVNFQGGTSPGTPGYVRVAGGQAAREVPGVDWGGTALIQMVAWQGNYTNWDDAWDAAAAGVPDVYLGGSNPLTLVLPPSPYSQNFTYLWGLDSFGIIASTFRGIFMTQPLSQTATVGEPVEFSVAVYPHYEPLFYQWYHNGLSIPDATTLSYRIPSVQPGDAGNYYASAYSLENGTTYSDQATLTVWVPPPIITSQPQSQTAVTGSSTVFRVSATGYAPLSYQWFFKGDSLAATGSSLKLAALQPQNSGTYSVLISNLWGAVTSAPAVLNVIPDVPATAVPVLVGSAESGTALNLQFADSLASSVNWQPLTELRLGTNTRQLYIDWPLPASYRFYRAWQTNGVSQPPVLAMNSIPAITLAGAIGSSVRVDYINQFGPTDAWVTLTTVTMTNTEQIYFDTSALGQPRRLYRLIWIP